MGAEADLFFCCGGHKPGLARVAALLAAVGSPQKGLRILHIAGTNGKGSTAAMLESILRAAGCCTGLFTSPYLSDYRESIRIGGEAVTAEALAKARAALAAAAASMPDAPTEFERSVAAALWLFKHAGCDAVILEAGLGGREDATNVIDAPVLAILTAIGLDHTRELGPALSDIATAKAGIIKPGCTVVSYGGVPEADAVIADTCRAMGTALVQADFSRLHIRRHTPAGFWFDFEPDTGLALPLAALYQPKNAALALTAVSVLRQKGWPISEDAVRRGLASVVWPGRFELLRRAPLFLLDGSHNPHGAAATCESLRALFPGQTFTFLLSIMADKDVTGILKLLCPLAEGFVTVTAANPRAMPAAELAEKIRTMGAAAESCPSIEKGVEAALKKSNGGPVCALGTLYFSADVRRAFLKLTNGQ